MSSPSILWKAIFLFGHEPLIDFDLLPQNNNKTTITKETPQHSGVFPSRGLLEGPFMAEFDFCFFLFCVVIFVNQLKHLVVELQGRTQ